MINDIEIKIADLRVDYVQNLPNKFQEIENLWDEVIDPNANQTQSQNKILTTMEIRLINSSSDDSKL